MGDTPPVSLRSRDWRWPIAVAAALLLLVGVLVARRLLRKKTPLQPVVTFVVPAAFKARLTGPAERALAAIDALEQAGTCARWRGRCRGRRT
jgi:hypothetical protein